MMSLKTDDSLHVQTGADIHTKATKLIASSAGVETHIKAGMKVVVEGGVSVTLKAGGNFVEICPAGVFVKGTIIGLNSGGAAGSGSGAQPEDPASPGIPDKPAEAAEADEDQAGQVATAQASEQETPDSQSTDETKVPAMSSAAQVLIDAAEAGLPFCEQCARALTGDA